MREIKFRVWNNITEEYMDCDSLVYANGEWYESESDFINRNELQDVTFEHYFGTNETTGEEIYENDIVDSNVHTDVVIRRDANDGHFYVENKKSIDRYKYLINNAVLMKVIGNAHE